MPTQETVSAPETEWKYSNLGYSLAGEIVAEVSGEPWARYIARHILGPLGMTATEPLPTADLPGLAVGYGRRIPGRAREIEPFLNARSAAPAASMTSNVEDLAKFVSLQFRDGPARDSQILSGSTLSEMHRVQWLHRDWDSGWGLGFSVRRVGDQVRIGHGGGIPGYTSYIEIAPAHKLGVIVMTNAGDESPLRYVDQAFKLLTTAITKTVTPSGSTVADTSWQRYVGRYTSRLLDIEIQVLDAELAMIFPLDDNPWESRMILEPTGPHTFRIVASGFTYLFDGDILTFEIDSSGNVVRVSVPYFYWLPIQ